MAGVSAPLSIKAFRAWVESRPDSEHWELIAGSPVMMAPPTKAHQQMLTISIDCFAMRWIGIGPRGRHFSASA